MSLTVSKESNGTHKVVISGVLKKTQMDSAQDAGKQEILRLGKVRLLVVLDGFEGWEQGAEWGDISFAATYGDKIEKMAIVGPPKWETQMLMFVGAGCRKTEVKYFTPENSNEAYKWLKG